MSFDEFTSKLMENKDLCDALAEAIKGQKLDDFLKEQNLDMSAEEFLNEITANADMSEEDLKTVAGGCTPPGTGSHGGGDTTASRITHAISIAWTPTGWCVDQNAYQMCH